MPHDRRYLRRATQFISLGLALLANTGIPAMAVERAAKETRLGEFDLRNYDAGNPKFWISPDGRHIAVMTEKGLAVDGDLKEYEYGAKEKSFTFSPDSQRHAYVAITGDNGRSEKLVVDGVLGEKPYSSVGAGPVFSPDSKHVGCIARLRASSFDEVPLVDGREGEPHEDFSWESAFTADSKRFVYAVEINDNYVMRYESVDGTEPMIERPHGPAVLTGNFFYGPAHQLGYVAKTPDHKKFVVYDGKEDANLLDAIDRSEVLVSENGAGIAFVGEPRSFRDVVVCNGQKSKVYEDFIDGTLEISPDGKHWGYAIEKRRKHVVVLDGKEQKEYDGVSGPVYSPDSKRVAYLAAVNGKVISVVDGKEGTGYDDRGLPTFGPDSAVAAFWAKNGDKTFIVANGKKQKDYDDVGTPKFSPDGKRIVYLAKVGEKWMMVDGEAEQKAYDDIRGEFYFSPDSRHLATIALDGEQQRVVIDGVEGNAYDQIVIQGGGKVHFDGPDQLHYLVLRGNEILLVEETLTP